MSTGIFPSILGTIVRSSPAPVIARICDWSSMTVSTSMGDNESSSIPGAASTALPFTTCVQPAVNNAAAHQTTNGLADIDMASSPSRIETSRHRILFNE